MEEPSIDQKLDEIMSGLQKLTKNASDDAAWKARVEEKMGNMERKVERIDKAVYGNGEPGISEKIRDHERRIAEAEATERACKINEAMELLEDIGARHAAEDERATKIEIKEVELRKFRYGLYSAVFVFVLDIITRAAMRIFGS